MIRKLESFRWIFFCAVLLTSAGCRGQTNCPWMNSATAAGILGVRVHATVMHPSKNPDDANCNFTSQQPGVTTLHIAVITMSTQGEEFVAYKRQCGPNPVPLKAIGNEAIECNLDTDAGRSVQVVGRVRNRLFVVNIGGSVLNGTGTGHGEQFDKARDVAEQVSESLY